LRLNARSGPTHILAMEIEKEKVKNAWVLSPQGKIEHENAPVFQRLVTEIIEQEKDSSILIDLSDIEFISSAGLRVFLIIAKTLQKDQRAFGLCKMNQLVEEIFEVSGFNQIIKVYPSRDEAEFLNA